MSPDFDRNRSPGLAGFLRRRRDRRRREAIRNVTGSMAQLAVSAALLGVAAERAGESLRVFGHIVRIKIESLAH